MPRFPTNSGGWGDEGWLDVMQVCENGHIITSMAKANPHDQEKRCSECGAQTIVSCKNCAAYIPGYYHDPDIVVVGGTTRPAYCKNCGEPFPWTIKESTSSAKTISKSSMPTTKKVFIVHGHDDAMKEAVARTLTDLGLEPVILHEQPNKGRTIIEKFEDHSDVGFAVVLLSADDMAYPTQHIGKKPKPRPRARQNVVAEMFFFFAKLGRGKVLALHKSADNFELPSDIQGILYTPFDDHGGWRMHLVQELRAAGYAVDANKLHKKT
jgi:predicted nucleotide-binding protein